MDRVGAMREYYNLHQRSLQVASTPFYKRYRLVLLILVLLVSLNVKDVFADTYSSPLTIVSFNYANCSYTGDINGLVDSITNCFNVLNPSYYYLIYLNRASNLLSFRAFTFSDGSLTNLQSIVYSVLSVSCPYGYLLSGNVCTVDTNYSAFLDWLVVNKAVITDLVVKVVQVDWLVANIAAIQNTLNNQSTLVAESFDPALAGEFFAWGFTGLMLVGIAAWGAGTLLGFIDRVAKH